MNSKYTHVIWDWNGTLLDDVERSIATINIMLRRRGMKMLKGREEYRGVFGFPVIEYYEKVGFDFSREPFEKLAEEFIGLFHAPGGINSPLQENAEEVLGALRERQVEQVILSAAQLEKQVIRAARVRYFAILQRDTRHAGHLRRRQGRHRA